MKHDSFCGRETMLGSWSHSNGDENPLILWNPKFITTFTQGHYFNLS